MRPPLGVTAPVCFPAAWPPPPGQLLHGGAVGRAGARMPDAGGVSVLGWGSWGLVPSVRPSVPLETFRPDACADEADPRDPSSGCEVLSVGVAPRLESCPLLLSFLRKITVLNRASGFIPQEVTSQRFPFLRGVHSALTGHDAGPRSTDDTADPCSSTPSHARAGVEGGSGHPHRPARPPSPHLQVSGTLSRDQEETGPKREGPRCAAFRHP